MLHDGDILFCVISVRIHNSQIYTHQNNILYAYTFFFYNFNNILLSV